MSTRSSAYTHAPVVALAAVFAGAVLYFSFASLEWSFVKRMVRSHFPGVRRITSRELADWLADNKRSQPLLLDVRTEAEYRVSHIDHAKRVEPGVSVSEAGLLAAKDAPIVTYCSVGYRSADFAAKLHDAGFSNVRNLDGSIFEWVNEGHPVERDGQRVNVVHPCNRFWGRLLKKQFRADVPPISD